MLHPVTHTDKNPLYLNFSENLGKKRMLAAEEREKAIQGHFGPSSKSNRDMYDMVL